MVLPTADSDSNRHSLAGPVKPAPATSSLAAWLSDPHVAEKAYDRVRPELEALERRQVRKVIVNTPETVRMLLACAPGIDELRDEIVGQLPRHPIRFNDELAIYALAFLHTYQGWQLARPDRTELESCLGEARALRAMLLTWAPTLANWGIYRPEQLAAIRGGVGHTDLAADVVALGRLSLERWGDIESKVPYGRRQAERAVVVGQELLQKLGAYQKQGRRRRDRDKLDLWQRSFTRLGQVYFEVRWSVQYVRRHHGDAEQIAPNMFRLRGGGRRRK